MHHLTSPLFGAGIVEDRAREEEGDILSTKKVCNQSLG